MGRPQRDECPRVSPLRSGSKKVLDQGARVAAHRCTLTPLRPSLQVRSRP
jgi:hypothetical protein